MPMQPTASPRPPPLPSAAHMQPSLPGFDLDPALFAPDGGRRHRAPLGYRLWMALFPSPAAAQHIADGVAPLWHRHGLTRTPLAPDRLHVSLLALTGGIRPPRQAIVDAALAAAAIVNSPPLPIVFDRGLTFAPSDDFVLRCTADGDAAIGRLRHMLAWTLRRRHLRPVLSGTPHMTLSYDPHRIGETPIAPISWTATCFALILSHVGARRHQRIGQWDLRGGGRDADDVE